VENFGEPVFDTYTFGQKLELFAVTSTHTFSEEYTLLGFEAETSAEQDTVAFPIQRMGVISSSCY